MRLEFNYVIIDDDFNDPDDCAEVEELIEKINNALKEKGFIPKCTKYISKEEFEKDSSFRAVHPNRIDLYLSDNNLGNSGGGANQNDHDNDGIQIYLDLKKKFICDFALYTRSDTNEIVNKMISYLGTQQDPGLFTRFNFIARGNDLKWHSEVLCLINFIITKREEMNNLRGLFAEKIAQMDLHLKNIFGRNKDEKFWVTLKNIPKNRFTPTVTFDRLNHLRQIRNALLHCNEYFDSRENEYIISYQEENSLGQRTSKVKLIRESESSKYRNWLTEVYTEVMSWK